MTRGHAGRFSQGWLLCRISHVKTGFWHLVVICDQTGALVIGTAHEHFIQVRDFECRYRSRSLVLRRLLMNSTDFLPRLRHHATHKPDPQVEQMSTDTSPPPLMVCFALASLALRRPFAPANNILQPNRCSQTPHSDQISDLARAPKGRVLE